MAVPIKLEELIKLTVKGVGAADINHNSVRMESDKFITVREASGNLSIIDMSNAARARTWPFCRSHQGMSTK